MENVHHYFPDPKLTKLLVLLDSPKPTDIYLWGRADTLQIYPDFSPKLLNPRLFFFKFLPDGLSFDIQFEGGHDAR